jgi:hypothetical protein
MSKRTVRAKAQTMPTDRRAVLRSILAAGAVVATPVGVAAPATLPPEIDQRTLDLWNRYKRLLEFHDRLSDRAEAAMARMPECARHGPKFLFSQGFEEMVAQVPGYHRDMCGWPAIEGLQRPPAGEKIVLRPNNEDLFEQFRKECDSLGRDQARKNFLASIIAFEDRCARQKEAEDEVGYTAMNKRMERATDVMFDVEDQIKARMKTGSAYALAAALLIRIGYNDDQEHAMRLYRASLATIRPGLRGPIAQAVDAKLAEADAESEEEA